MPPSYTGPRHSFVAVATAGSSFGEAIDVVVMLNRDYALGPLVFTLGACARAAYCVAALSGRECTEDQGGQRGLLYLLERKRYENAVRDASVFVVRTATRNATMHD